MTIRSMLAILFLLTVSAPACAQSGSLQGTWSGNWLTEDGKRNAVTIRFADEDGSVTGSMVNPDGLEFDRVSFESTTGAVVAEADARDDGPVKIEARIEAETRLNGTLTQGGRTGDIQLTKWTYVPRIR